MRNSSLRALPLLHLGHGSLLSVNIVAFILGFIATVIVVASVSSIIVVSEDEDVFGDSRIVDIFEGANSMELLPKGTLYDLVLISLVEFNFMFEVDLVIARVFDFYIVRLHVHRDWQDPRQGEVGIFDVLSVYFFIPVQQVGVFEFLDWLLS